MSEATEPMPGPVTKVARDLREIEDLSALLLTQAVHKANDREMPGGDAMVALAGVANLEAWQNVVDTSLRLAYEYGEEPPEIDDDEDYEPPLQTLCFWSEQLRTEHGDDYGRTPTIASEVNYLRFMLNHLWETEPHWEDFTRDIKRARRRLEDLLHAGERVERGVPCMYDECKGARLTRKILDDGSRTDWSCRRCKRTWSEDRYAAMVTAGHEAAKVESIDEETWCSEEYAVRETGRSIKTIRTWVNDGKVDVLCLIAGKRKRFVNLNQLREQDARAGRRMRSTA